MPIGPRIERPPESEREHQLEQGDDQCHPLGAALIPEQDRRPRPPAAAGPAREESTGCSEMEVEEARVIGASPDHGVQDPQRAYQEQDDVNADLSGLRVGCPASPGRGRAWPFRSPPRHLRRPDPPFPEHDPGEPEPAAERSARHRSRPRSTCGRAPGQSPVSAGASAAAGNAVAAGWLASRPPVPAMPTSNRGTDQEQLGVSVRHLRRKNAAAGAVTGSIQRSSAAPPPRKGGRLRSPAKALRTPSTTSGPVMTQGASCRWPRSCSPVRLLPRNVIVISRAM